jgi:hypothetical protein
MENYDLDDFCLFQGNSKVFLNNCLNFKRINKLFRGTVKSSLIINVKYYKKLFERLFKGRMIKYYGNKNRSDIEALKNRISGQRFFRKKKFDDSKIFGDVQLGLKYIKNKISKLNAKFSTRSILSYNNHRINNYLLKFGLYCIGNIKLLRKVNAFIKLIILSNICNSILYFYKRKKINITITNIKSSRGASIFKGFYLKNCKKKEMRKRVMLILTSFIL